FAFAMSAPAAAPPRTPMSMPALAPDQLLRQRSEASSRRGIVRGPSLVMPCAASDAGKNSLNASSGPLISLAKTSGLFSVSLRSRATCSSLSGGRRWIVDAHAARITDATEQQLARIITGV